MSAIDPTSIPVVIPKRVTSCQKALRVKRGLMRTCPPTMAAWYGIDSPPEVGMRRRAVQDVRRFEIVEREGAQVD